MKLVKTVNLRGLCEDEIKKLERAHYEAMTKEKLLALLISMDQASKEIIDERYEDYLETYKKYEEEKNIFFNNIISQYVDNPQNSWHIDFITGDLEFYE